MTTRTRDEAVRWAWAQKGKWIDEDGWYGAQCVDLILAYCHYLGVAPPRGNAKEWAYLSLPRGWTRVQNTPTYVPKPGEIVVWTGGRFGHIGIVLSADVRTFTSMEQNVVGNLTSGSAAEVRTHTNWRGLWFIRPDFVEAGSGARTGNRTVRVIARAGLRVRAKATTRSETLRILSHGDRVSVGDTVKAGGYTWGKLTEGQGWIALEYTTDVG